MKALIVLPMLALLMSVTAHAEPATCTEAYRACVKPDYGHCDAGCASTCRLRAEGCMKTGSFSTPRVLLKGLKRQ